MRILVVIATLHYGGAERVVSLLTQQWARDHEITLVVFDKSNQGFTFAGTVVELYSTPSERVWGKAYKLVTRSLRIMRLLRTERPDRIISFMESANFPSVIAAMFTRSLGRLRVSVRTNPRNVPTTHRALIPWCYRWPERVIAVSAGVRMALIRMGLRAERVSAIPNPIVMTEGPRGVRRPPLECRFILGVGRLHVEKGFDRLIRAFAQLRCQELQLVILGDGQERDNLGDLARELGLATRVQFKGRVVDVSPWYQHAECFVLSSRYEGWPNVVGEAMANGCPVVSYDCRYGPSEIIEHGKSGLLVADGDVDALATAMARVVSDDALRSRLVSEGRSRMRSFALEKIAPQWLEDVAWR